MDECIVWDEKNKLFLNEMSDFNEITSKTNDLAYYYDEYWQSSVACFFPKECEGQFSKYFYIGKKDINGNKIYADCSIVEFDYFNGEDISILQGYFYYNNENMQYEIDITKGHESSGKFDFKDLIGIKVIGTLQENKELLA